MSELLDLLRRPEALVIGASLLLILMMLLAIMLRISRKDEQSGRRMDELKRELDDKISGVRALTENQLNENHESLRRSVEELNDGVTKALSASEYGQSGRMDDYAARINLSAQAEAERSRQFDADVQRRMDELSMRIDQNHADTSRRMDKLKLDISRETAREVNARLDGVVAEMSAHIAKLSGEIAKLDGATSELDQLKEALGARPHDVVPRAQLDALLAQWLSPGRYVRDFEVGTGSGHVADFAILLPDDAGQMLYLPVDASFPVEKFTGAWTDEAHIALGESVDKYSRNIAQTLIKPGLTTDFALMLISSELVSARVSELDGVMQSVQQAQRVIPVGPASFWAMVRALEGGMNALAMQRHSHEVEKLLEQVREELGRFSRMIDLRGATAVPQDAPHDAPNGDDARIEGASVNGIDAKWVSGGGIGSEDINANGTSAEAALSGAGKIAARDAQVAGAVMPQSVAKAEPEFSAPTHSAERLAQPARVKHAHDAIARAAAARTGAALRQGQAQPAAPRAQQSGIGGATTRDARGSDSDVDIWT